MKSFFNIATITVSLLFMGCGDNKENQKADSSKAKVEKLETFSLKKQSIDTEITLPAELTGFRQVDLFAKVNSYVKVLKVDIGADVKQGQLLVQLEAPEISSQLAAAQSRLHSQEAIYTASNSTYQRLFETSKVEGTISKNDLELALSKKNADFANLQAAKAGIREIQVMQGYLQIRAPFSGKITARNVNVGAYVGQGGQTALLTIQDNQKLRLAVSVPESYSSYLKLGDVLNFRIASLNGQKFTSRISRMSGALDTRLRSQRIEMDINETKGVLLSGMVAEVFLPLNNEGEIFVIPTAAVITNSEGNYIIKVVDRKAQRIPVELGMNTDENVQIFSDSLHENDVLLSKGNDEIKNGTVIN